MGFLGRKDAEGSILVEVIVRVLRSLPSRGRLDLQVSSQGLVSIDRSYQSGNRCDPSKLRPDYSWHYLR